jgi:ribosomal protein S18 acetylase RimI-like enzyme
MVETVTGSSSSDGLAAAAQLLHDFNREYDEPAPPPDEVAIRLAELYVVPDRRGQGYGRAMITEAMRLAREQGADYAFLITSEEHLLAQRLYEAAGFRRTEGEGGPVMLAYEREL